jgi:hypothetical protein
MVTRMVDTKFTSLIHTLVKVKTLLIHVQMGSQTLRKPPAVTMKNFL